MSAQKILTQAEALNGGTVKKGKFIEARIAERDGELGVVTSGNCEGLEMMAMLIMLLDNFVEQNEELDKDYLRTGIVMIVRKWALKGKHEALKMLAE